MFQESLNFLRAVNTPKFNWCGVLPPSISDSYVLIMCFRNIFSYSILFLIIEKYFQKLLASIFCLSLLSLKRDANSRKSYCFNKGRQYGTFAAMCTKAAHASILIATSTPTRYTGFFSTPHSLEFNHTFYFWPIIFRPSNSPASLLSHYSCPCNFLLPKIFSKFWISIILFMIYSSRGGVKWGFSSKHFVSQGCRCSYMFTTTENLDFITLLYFHKEGVWYIIRFFQFSFPPFTKLQRKLWF